MQPLHRVSVLRPRVAYHDTRRVWHPEGLQTQLVNLSTQTVVTGYQLENYVETGVVLEFKQPNPDGANFLVRELE